MFRSPGVTAGRPTPPAGASFGRTVGSADASRRPGRRIGAGGLVALMAVGTLPAIGLATAANAAVTIGSNISIFPDRDFVVAVGYTEGQNLLIEVLRNDVVIGSAEGPAVETPEGIGLEVNHGPLGAPLPGDCWTGFTPDIVGGDVIRVTPGGSAVEPGPTTSDTATVADVAFSGPPELAPNGVDVLVRGTATPGTDFAVEFRRDKPDPRFRRGPFVPVYDASTADPNDWTATFRPTATSAEGLTAAQQRQIALTEASWLAVADSITETTLAELGEPGGVGPGCTGSSDPNSLVGGLDPVNIASGDVTFSGTTRAGVTGVSLTVGGLGARDAVVAADRTWTLTVPKADLATLPEGTIAVTPRFLTTTPDPTDPTLPGTTTTVTGAVRSVLKDTVAPLAPTPSVAPGTYTIAQSVALNKPAGEGLSKVYWEIGNTAVPDPDGFSNLYTGQISVTSNQTITGRLIDAAGNPGAVGTFAYRIGNPPAAPTGLTGSESTTAPETATLRWTGVTGVSGYNVYQDGIKVNTALLAGTTFTHAAAGLGDHSYVVRSVDANGIESLDSNVVTVTIAAPDVPTGLRVTEGNAQVTVAWTAVTGATGYRVYRDNVVVAQRVAGTSYTNVGLVNGSLYEYEVSSLDAGGNESPRSGLIQASPVAPPADTTAPTVSARNPASAATGVAIGNNVTATFSEAVQGVDGTTFFLRAAGSTTNIPATVTYDAATRIATLNPTASLAASTQYTATLTGGTTAIRDAAGNPLANDSWSFTTAAPADTTAPTVSTRNPASAATGVAVGNNVTATFSEAVQGVSGTTFFLRAAGSTTNIPATVTYANGVATLDPTANLAAGTQYTATLTGGTTAIRDAANLALATTSWSFTTAAAADTTAPTVSTRNPASAATGVAVGNNVTATFSEAVQGVSGTTFFLRAAGSTTNIGAAVTYDATTRVATLNPTVDLAPGTSYTATLTGGSTAIRDGANLPLATTSWSFTTAAATTNVPPTVITSSRLPGPSFTNQSVGTNVNVTFSEAVVGVGTGTFQLRAPDSTVVPATVTASTTVANQWILNPTANLAADTRYTVTLTGGAAAIRDTANAPLATTSWNFLTGAAPTVTARTPGVNATAISRTADVSATFSEAVTGVSTTTFRLTQVSTGAAITATVTRDGTTNRWVLNPSATLLAGTQYRVTLTSGTTAIRDAAGNPLSNSTAAPITWTFTTGTA